MFEIGEKILCIDSGIKPELLFSILRDFPNWLKEGECTVREVLYNDDIVTGILLEEYHNPPIFIKLLGRMQEPAFATWRFRKKTYQELEEDAEIDQIEKQTQKILEGLEEQNEFVEAHLN